ncbi:MFS general substrate transporter [Aspergillus aurantiobrunneus]
MKSRPSLDQSLRASLANGMTPKDNQITNICQPTFHNEDADSLSVFSKATLRLSMYGDVELQPVETYICTTGHSETILSGWRLRLLTIGLCICCFLASLDTIIVSTSLTTITKDLQTFDRSSWVVASYLTSYSSILVIWEKVSDLVGRKLMLVAAMVMFLAFSGGCGGAKTTSQLIILRTFQGIGGGGIFSMKYAAYNTLIAFSIALSFLLGPLIGGAIADHISWSWILYINLPSGAVGLILISLSMPGAFPSVSSPTVLWGWPKIMDFGGRIDYLGFGLLLAASIFLIVAIEEAAVLYTWNAAVVIVLLSLAAILVGGFLTWEWYLYWRRLLRVPVFPWEFVKDRVYMGTCLYARPLQTRSLSNRTGTALLSGVPFMTVVLELPGRFQLLNNMSGLDSGVRILPFTLTIALASALAGGLTASGHVPPFIVFLASSALQVLGVGLLYSVHPSGDLGPSVYGYELLAGMGVGLNLTTATLVVPSLVERRSLSLGSVTQLRVLGGAIGVSIATSLLKNTVQSRLANGGPSEVLEDIMQDVSSVDRLPPSMQTLVRAAFADRYEQQLAMVLGLCAAQVLALGLMWERPMRRLA